METYYWFRDGEFGEVHAYTWEEAKKKIGNEKFVHDADFQFSILTDAGNNLTIPRWAVPKEFLVKLMLLGVPL